MKQIAVKEWDSMGPMQRFTNVFGVAIAAGGPVVATGDMLNVFGVKDIANGHKVMALPRAALEDFTAEPPDLHPDKPPTMRPAHQPPEIRPPYEAATKPVMDE